MSSVTLIAVLILSCLPGLQATTFNIETNKAGPSLIDEFLSVTISTGLAGHWSEFNFSSPLVNTLAKALSPLVFRYGGTSQDETTYNTNGNVTKSSIKYSQYILNMSEFSQLADFAQRNGWKLVFGLNAQERFPNNTWNPSNSRDLMTKIIESGRDNLIVGYELGNEPDLYYRHTPNFTNVTAKQLSNDFVTLYNLINNIVYKTSNYKPFIWGCDVAGSFTYLQQFVSNSTTQTLNGVTWHQYYGNSSTWTLSDFISIKHMDSLIHKINDSLNIIHEYLSKTSYDILGETSSSYGGGTANLSASFVAGFLWLDKLGLSSVFGLYLVARQTFWGGNYGLIDRYDFNPNADYWSSYLFRNLVGNKVLYVEGEFENGRTIRVYAYCTRTKDKGSVYDYSKGSITTMILNVQNNTVSVDLKMIGKELKFNQDVVAMSYDEYLLTSYPNVLNSKDIFLNGKVMKMVNDNTFPELKPVSVTVGSSVNMEALSYGFVVILNANVSVCM